MARSNCLKYLCRMTKPRAVRKTAWEEPLADAGLVAGKRDSGERSAAD